MGTHGLGELMAASGIGAQRAVTVVRVVGVAVPAMPKIGRAVAAYASTFMR